MRGLLAPARIAYRRPGRTAILIGILSAVLGTLAATALWIWLGYNLRAARREVERGHNAAAARHLESCRRIQPEHPEVLLLAARVARRSGSWAEAEVLLDKYWQRYGDGDPLVLERLLLRATRGDLESAAPLLLARIAEGGATAGPAREALVNGLLYRFRWAEAERAIAAWLTADPDDTAALLLQGKLHEQRAATSEALLAFRRIVELDPDHDEARLRMTTLLLQSRKGEEAVTNLGYLRGRLPDNPEVQVQWVRALALQGRTDEARADLDDCLRRHPDFPPALAERGKLAMTDGDERTAEEYLGRASRLDPGNTATRHQYALALGRNGKPADAAREEDAIRQLQADYERITQLIQGPLQTNPNDPAVHHEIAQIALRAGQPTEALRWLQSALQVSAEHQPTHQLLAVYYHETGAPALAAKHQAIAQRLGGQKHP